MATIAENLQSLVTAKNDIATAITNKGIVLPENAGFVNFASAIDSIEAQPQIEELYPTDITRNNSDNRIITYDSDYSDYSVRKPYAAYLTNCLLYICVYVSLSSGARGSSTSTKFIFNDLPTLPSGMEFELMMNSTDKKSGSAYITGGIFGYNENGKFYLTVGAGGSGSGYYSATYCLKILIFFKRS